MKLYPSLAHLASGPAAPRARAGVELARERAQQALELCAERLGLKALALDFPRDAERAPLPMQMDGKSWHWSTTHTEGLAAALLGPLPLGIDAEWLQRPRQAAVGEYFSKHELALLQLPAERAALALWSAKEAVLKLSGIGMAGMGRTTLESCDPGGRMRLRLDDRLHLVRQSWLPEHVLSCAISLSPSIQDFEIELRFVEPAVEHPIR